MLLKCWEENECRSQFNLGHSSVIFCGISTANLLSKGKKDTAKSLNYTNLLLDLFSVHGANLHKFPAWSSRKSISNDVVSCHVVSDFVTFVRIQNFVCKIGGKIQDNCCFQISPTFSFSLAPLTFKPLQAAVIEKKWIMMGGWNLRPDLNVDHPSCFTRHFVVILSVFRRLL